MRLAPLLLMLSAGCALRPLYRELVPSSATGSAVHFTLRDTVTHQAIANAMVEVGDGASAVRATTSPQGHFSLPVKPKFDERSLVVVTLPAGVAGYAVEPTAVASLDPAYRCGVLFDEVSPLMVAEWTRAMPQQVEAARKALPELRQGFAERCKSLSADEIACGEDANNTAGLNASCRGIADALDAAGHTWAETYLKR